ncbi:MAG: hypothetical protein IPP62_10305 [bacterium]|jgi:hypothetical protein|nr:hypothetical protein [bacterium]
MRHSAKAIIALVICALFAGSAFAADVTVDPTKITNAYMNVWDLSNVYQFGGVWGFADLVASYSGSNLTLSPNSINDPNPYWYLPGGGPGSVGQKIMYADSYAQVDDGSLAGQTLTFTGTVLTSTLTSAHVAKAFIRDFAPDFSSVVETMVTLPASGAFSVSQVLSNDPARHVQYGFEMVGVCVWITDVAPYGNIVIAPYLPVSVEDASFGDVKALFR